MADPTNPNPRLPEWTELLADMGYSVDAVDLVDRAVAARPGDPELRIAQVQARWANGDAGATLEAVDEALLHAPMDEVRAMLLSIRAGALVELGRASEAIAPAAEGVRLAPATPPALFTLATAYAAAGKDEDARSVASGLLETAPEAPHGHVALAAAASGQREREDHLRRALELAPEDEHLLLSLGAALLEQGRDREALDVLAHASSRWPRSRAARGMALKAAARIEGLWPALPFPLFITALIVERATDGRPWWLSASLFGIAVASVVFAWWRRSRNPLPAEAKRVAKETKEESRRGMGLAFLGAFAFGLVLIPTFWVGLFGLPALSGAWGEVHWVQFAIAGGLIALGFWFLWLIRQRRRLGPRLIWASAATCRCEGLSVLTGPDACRYVKQHLWRTERGDLFPQEFTCPDTGRRWIGYQARVGWGPGARRLVQLSSDDDASVEVETP
jgi:Flp pilus assembly protein TadD